MARLESALDERQRRFLAARRQLVPYLRPLLSVAGVGFLGFAVWLVIRQPLLVDPFAVIDRVAAGTLEYSTLVLLATLAAALGLLLLILLAALLLVLFDRAAAERRYLEIIDRLQASE